MQKHQWFLGLGIGAFVASIAFVQPAFASDDEAVVAPHIVEAAEKASVDPLELKAALLTVGEADPYEYLYNSGELQRPRPLIPAAPAVAYGIWDRLAQCESNGRWSINAYHDGGLQFLPSTWSAYKDRGDPVYAWQASRETQIKVGIRVQRAQGWEAWPACSRRLGLR